jgi:hypothetical protein
MKSTGIIYEFTTYYLYTSNGHTKQVTRTITTITRIIILDTSNTLPLNLYIEEATTSIYLKNTLAYSVVRNNTNPY